MMRTRLVLAACLLSLCLNVSARDAVVGMSERVFKVITEAQTLMEEEQYDAALSRLGTLNENRLSNYENAQVLRLRGLVHYSADRLDEAMTAFERAVAQPRLPDALIANLLATVARVALGMEDYSRAESSLLELMALPNQQIATNRVLLANAYIGQSKFREALTPLLKALADHKAAGNTPPESWLSMLASTHYALEDLEAMRTAMTELTALYPREQYFMNLAALHGQLGDQPRQLALVEALLEDSRLNQEAHVKLIANLYLAEATPVKAAALLQERIDQGTLTASRENLELLSQSWYAAGEVSNALLALQRAADKAQVGELYLRLAGLHMDVYEWREAETAAARALELGGLRNEGNAWLLRGMAQVNLKRWRDADAHFKKASGFDTTAEYARQWQAYVSAERGKELALQ